MKNQKMLMAIFLACFTLFYMNSKAQDNTKIGEQTWTTKSLDVVTFKNGDTIPEAKTYEEWKKNSKEEKPAWCYYENKATNGQKYGKLYNWWTVTDSRGLAPAGFHIPSEDEWDKMIEFLGGKKEAGSKLKSKNWEGTNSTGFNAQAGGMRQSQGPSAGSGAFSGMNDDTFFWSSTPKQIYGMNSFRKDWILKTQCYVGGLKGGAFLYVRCIKD